MSYRRQIYFTSEQKTEIRDRWQRGVSMSLIGKPRRKRGRGPMSPANDANH